jgi:hypothetical protein
VIVARAFTWRFLQIRRRVSPSTRRRDGIRERRLYERMGVGEYWNVDPEIGR